MEFNNNKAIYLQIADLICENILSQKWKVNERIPSIREIAVDLEVNPNTVVRTYNYLQDIEIIQNKRGIGYFVASEGLEKTLNYKKKEFIEIELPDIYKKMDLLGITIDQLKTWYVKK